MNQRMRQEKIQEVEKGLAVKAGDKDYTGAARLQAELAAFKKTTEIESLQASAFEPDMEPFMESRRTAIEKDLALKAASKD